MGRERKEGVSEGMEGEGGVGWSGGECEEGRVCVHFYSSVQNVVSHQRENGRKKRRERER